MLSYLIPLLSISSFSTEVTYRSNSSVDVNYDKTKLIQMIKKINHGNRVVHDMCESLEEKYSFMGSSNKPSCRFKVSHINKTNINLYKIKEEVRNFLLTEKKLMCKDEKIECGSLTVILKILDLVNSAIDVSININDFVINIELIEFDVLFDTYMAALDNIDLLTNITLSRTKLNLILNREKEKLKALQNRHGVWKLGDTLSIYIGEPIKNTLTYTGDVIGTTLGSTVGSTIDGVTPSVSLGFENKVLIGLLSILVFLRR